MTTCRKCGAALDEVVIDMGQMPSANAFLAADADVALEAKFPLIVYVCTSCWLVQIPEFNKAAVMFSGDYRYFSSVSAEWVQHAKRYCADVTARLSLNGDSHVIEVASNDGYLLRHFVTAKIPCLGIDPAANAAREAEKFGVETRVCFFGRETAATLVAEGRSADLLAANNVLAHVPDPGDFIGGVATVLKPNGVATFEFPHLARMLEGTQFDTIYDEHYSYLSLAVVHDLLTVAGLRVFDVQRLKTHGGSLRVFACGEGALHETTDAVAEVLGEEDAMGLRSVSPYRAFNVRAEAIREAFCAFIATAKAEGKSIAAFGAAAKGTMFLNYCGIDASDIAFVVDDTPAKQGLLMPGVHLPVVSFDKLLLETPDVIIILAWNVAPEIVKRIAPARDWGATFVTCIPTIEVL